MRVKYLKHAIEVIPENDLDEVYLESVLDLKEEGEQAIAERVAVLGLPFAWAFLEIKRSPKEKT